MNVNGAYFIFVRQAIYDRLFAFISCGECNEVVVVVVVVVVMVVRVVMIVVVDADGERSLSLSVGTIKCIKEVC